MTATLTKIRRIGNSKGILFPKSMLDQTGIKDNVTVTVKNKSIVISSAEPKKKKWADFKKGRKNKVGLVSNKFDESEWTW